MICSNYKISSAEILFGVFPFQEFYNLLHNMLEVLNFIRKYFGIFCDGNGCFLVLSGML
jgi:hypothetical protein